MAKEIGNPQGDILDLLISAKLGDGGMYQNGINYYMGLYSKNLDYLEYKRVLSDKYVPSEITEAKSGFKEGSFSYRFHTRNHPDITKVALMSIESAISLLTLQSLITLYLDDGSYHQRKNFMHIYCNMFSIEETQLLVDKIYELYPIKRPTLRWDRKKDGREFPYLYIPVSTSNEFKKDVEEFLTVNNIKSLMYKVGKNIPSTANETELRGIG